MLESITCTFQNGITRLNRTSRSIVMGLQSFGWADGPWRTARGGWPLAERSARTIRLAETLESHNY
jgi:hypothetical protein